LKARGFRKTHPLAGLTQIAGGRLLERISGQAREKMDFTGAEDKEAKIPPSAKSAATEGE
jgi:hypothetical protein